MKHAAPKTLDHVSIDTDRQCQRYRGEQPERCTNTAEFVFVYEGSLDLDDDTRRNCLACEDCVPVDTQQ